MKALYAFTITDEASEWKLTLLLRDGCRAGKRRCGILVVLAVLGDAARGCSVVFFTFRDWFERLLRLHVVASAHVEKWISENAENRRR